MGIIYHHNFSLERFGCPDYFEIIKYPMDLSTVLKKLQDKVYNDEDAFALDIRMMISNCMKYNGADHPYATYALQFENVFEKKLSDLKIQKERSKLNIFDKLDQKEKEILEKIENEKAIIQNLNAELLSISQQRKEEMEKIEAMKNIPKKKKLKKVKKIKSVDTIIDYSSDEDIQQQQQQPQVKPEKSPIESKAEHNVEMVTHEERLKVMEEINKLPTEIIEEVVAFIKRHESSVIENEDGEYDFDFSEFKNSTILALKTFLTEIKKKAKTIVTVGRGKAMNLDPKELSKQEGILKQELEYLNEQLGMGSAKMKKEPELKPPSSSSSSSSSDSDSGSSESSSAGRPSSATLPSSDNEEDE